MKPNNKQKTDSLKKPFDKPLYQPGGIYFHAGAIIGRKNVFVTEEYIAPLINAFKMAELRQDVKNLAYVVMPNFFYWMFRLSSKQDNPVKIYGELKRDMACSILDNLKEEVKSGKSYQLRDLFKSNERGGRSRPEKILWTFEEKAKDFKNNKRYRVWAPRTEIRLIDSPELLKQKLAIMKASPISERWQMTAEGQAYPYLYVSEEILEMENADLSKLTSFLNKYQLSQVAV